MLFSLSLSLKCIPEAMSRQGDDGWVPPRNASHSSSIITDAINFSEAYTNTEIHSSVVFILYIFFVSFFRSVPTLEVKSVQQMLMGTE